MTTPAQAYARLLAAERDGELARFADEHGLALIVVFGSAARGEPTARDLDRAGIVARQQALVPGHPLYEHEAGGFGREQMRASGERLSTEWLRRRSLERLAGRL